MAAKSRISSRRMARPLVAERSGADSGEGAEQYVPGAAEKVLGKDGGCGARQPNEDVGVAPSQPDRQCQEHRRKGEVEAETLGIAGGAADQVPGQPGGKPGTIEQEADAHEKGGERCAQRGQLVASLGRLAHLPYPILVGSEQAGDK